MIKPCIWVNILVSVKRQCDSKVFASQQIASFTSSSPPWSRWPECWLQSLSIWFNYREASYGGSSTSFLKQSWDGNVLPWPSVDSRPVCPKSVWRVWLEPLTYVWLVFLVNMVIGQTHTTVVVENIFKVIFWKRQRVKAGKTKTIQGIGPKGLLDTTIYRAFRINPAQCTRLCRIQSIGS